MKIPKWAINPRCEVCRQRRKDGCAANHEQNDPRVCLDFSYSGNLVEREDDADDSLYTNAQEGTGNA